MSIPSPSTLQTRTPSRWRGASVAAATTALLLAPQLADACAVCGIGRDDETRTAFILTTGFMTVLPLLIIGGSIWWLRRRVRERAQRDAPAGIAPATGRTPLRPAPLRSALPGRSSS